MALAAEDAEEVRLPAGSYGGGDAPEAAAAAAAAEEAAPQTLQASGVHLPGHLVVIEHTGRSDPVALRAPLAHLRPGAASCLAPAERTLAVCCL